MMDFRAILGAAFVLALGGAGAAGAQPLALQGIADAELWSTDAKSPLLTRNGGRTGAAQRLSLWGAVELRPWLIAFAQGEVEGGHASRDGITEAHLDQAGVRLVRGTALVIDAGRMPHVIGAFAGRRFSTRNPLVGTPDAYPVRYPLGVQVSGTRGLVDYRTAIVSLPVTHESYMPEPDPVARPALGFGITPVIGFHVGVSGTWGPYLNADVQAALPAGRSWRSLRQRVGALEAAFSRGFLETHAELAIASYDAPTAGTLRGIAYYGEAKYTVTPRVFAAARYERNDYPFVRLRGDGTWIERTTDFANVEAGVGVRLTASLLAKGSWRADRWLVPPELRGIMDDGRAFAMQLSYAFDVVELARR